MGVCVLGCFFNLGLVLFAGCVLSCADLCQIVLICAGLCRIIEEALCVVWQQILNKPFQVAFLFQSLKPLQVASTKVNKVKESQ